MPDQQSAGPDLSKGVRLAEFPGAMLLGHVGDEDVLLVRHGTELFAVGAHCTHYHGPLVDGLVVGDTVRCPWHHACFDLRTGDAARPGLEPHRLLVASSSDERQDLRARKREQPTAAAANATVERAQTDCDRRRRRGRFCRGRDAAARGYRRQHRHAERRRRRAGRPAESVEGLSRRQCARGLGSRFAQKSFYAEAASICGSRRMSPASTPGAQESRSPTGAVPYDRLLLATGAEPVRLSIPGADQPHVHTLRSLADCRAIIERANGARRAVVLGRELHRARGRRALRARDLEVHVVAPEKRPMERILGPQMGDFVRALHEEHGVIFHLGRHSDARSMASGERSKSGGTLEARSRGRRHRRSAADRARRTGRARH